MITHTQFSMQVAYMASTCASWAADCLTLPEDHEQPMRDESAKRFISQMRERLERIEAWHERPRGDGMATVENVTIEVLP